MREMTAAQRAAVERLRRGGWIVNFRDEDTVYLSKRGKPGQTRYCQVDAQGAVN
jgi:DNA-binding transcriptional regulator PaaX